MVFFSYFLEEQENIVVPTIKQSMENVMVGHHSFLNSFLEIIVTYFSFLIDGL